VVQDAIMLMGLVALLYVGDSALLLHRNEGVLIAACRERWSVDLGSRDYQLANKHVFIPNPLFPHRPLFRLTWRLEGTASDTTDDWGAHQEAVRSLAPIIWAMAAALFGLLPLGFFTRLGDPALVAALVLLYLGIIAALIWVWRNRLRFDLNRAQFAALAFESLVCSPLALNLARKLCARIPVREDLVSASRRLQNADGWQATRSKLVERLDEAIEVEAEASPRMAEMIDHRRRIMEQ
jgi:hypothetical protein